ncbi:MAG TPA: sorbitol-6-phosphate dehydrogenase [Candidatus Hydrogenedentes bacterium]|jgi:sorbitol-6-phosphate 2-dehydrogenase|nr:MAG: Sorbitol-6-phosphate 2-dehydrogenase [Candidatus Hydrogenedentes bacterium ADurb.Bin170]HNZ49258.1 sorbitol-6-phosphate dehydrogenase [Candidatus Hydrogenedentota bacterium]HOD96367.1 sorbitol-6-phosphate dehydrogenase [Candidatus Hydrogenedentota bacterium]HOH42992.1 sorbitol-6-phosphate dehydrogenase [Candidatus Hydrogenedentota bacterium]HOM49412.1 sorbitol-6-phosphate dehydrogenase [Candidatus Hydrogenedentota bacterium]
MNTLTGKKAIVTGGAQGLGAAISERLAAEGCDLEIWDINEEVASSSAAAIASKTGQQVRYALVDVTDAGAVRAAVDHAVSWMGGLDIMVCNAGILISGDSIEMDASAWRKVIDVDLTGYFFCAREAARVMVPARKGSIIQINSKSGKKGSFKNAAYAAAKFGGVGLTQSLALEFAESGVRVNAILPGNLLNSPLWVNSLFKQYARNQGISEAEVRQKYIDQVPMKRPCEYEDVCNVVVFFAGEGSSYMTGQAINVTGGQEMR